MCASKCTKSELISFERHTVSLQVSYNSTGKGVAPAEAKGRVGCHNFKIPPDPLFNVSLKHATKTNVLLLYLRLLSGNREVTRNRLCF